MENEIVKTEATSPAKLLELAISKDVDIDKLQKLMDLQERWDEKQAKKSFLAAMSKFQSECPELTKSKVVAFGQTKYSYIPLGEISKQIKTVLRDSGLSYRWETQENGKISITCIVSHADGHSESNTMTAEKDASGSKNSIQQIGSTMTYLQRYTLIGALGISSADQDVDAEQPKKEAIKLNEEKSGILLKKAMGEIDEYTDHSLLTKSAKSFLNKKIAEGLSSSDQEKLTKYINANYESLKSEK